MKTTTSERSVRPFDERRRRSAGEMLGDLDAEAHVEGAQTWKLAFQVCLDHPVAETGELDRVAAAFDSRDLDAALLQPREHETGPAADVDGRPWLYQLDHRVREQAVERPVDGIDRQVVVAVVDQLLGCK